MKQILATVVFNRRLPTCPGAEYFLMRVRTPEIASECRPGQYLMIKCGGETLLRRPISIHSIVGKTGLELLYALPCKTSEKKPSSDLKLDTELQTATGTGTRWLSNLKKNSRLDLIGPLGNGFTIKPSANRLLLVAGGIGLSPLRFLANYAAKMGKHVTLLLGARTSSGILPYDKLPAKVKVVIATEDGTVGRKDTIIKIIPEYIEEADQVFACGPLAMYQALADQMRSWPVEKPVQVSLEVRMGCGTGVCYSCSIKTRQGMRRVCKEGPVFNIKDIIWQEVKI